jgi:hypothetical protein
MAVSPLPEVQVVSDGASLVSAATAQTPTASVAASSVIDLAADSSPTGSDQAPGVSSLPVESVA